MKLAITGKGGVGKSSLAATLALLLAERGREVLAVDADPDANLAQALGISAREAAGIVPMVARSELIEERTGSKPGQSGQVFKLNPTVSDLAERFAYLHRGVGLLILGAVERGGGGCACPESVFLKSLVTDLVLYKNQALILDMEAGIEHLGRATAGGVDCMIVVVEPGLRSLDTAGRIKRMAAEIGLSRLALVGNKICSRADEDFIRENAPELDVLGFVPQSEEVRAADRDGKAVLDGLGPDMRGCFENILENLLARSL